MSSLPRECTWATLTLKCFPIRAVHTGACHDRRPGRCNVHHFGIGPRVSIVTAQVSRQCRALFDLTADCTDSGAATMVGKFQLRKVDVLARVASQEYDNTVWTV